MSNLKDEQSQVELETFETEHHITMGEDLAWLKQNPQFQRVITEGYLKAKALDSISMLADPGVIRRGERSAIMEDLVAGSNLNYFFMMVEYNHAGAMNAEMEEEEPEEDEGNS
jgi:hypothetical protein